MNIIKLNEEIEELLIEKPEVIETPVEEKEENPVDTLTVDIPLMMRLLEYAREDAEEDIDLHFIIENALKIQQEKPILNMEDYENIIHKIENNIDENLAGHSFSIEDKLTSEEFRNKLEEFRKSGHNIEKQYDANKIPYYLIYDMTGTHPNHIGTMFAKNYVFAHD